ncbi:MAG: hypothetical protein JWQ20_1320 [Conexibacter sp.]|nr:hypothetical protein [Conexibacter sp.]
MRLLACRLAIATLVGSGFLLAGGCGGGSVAKIDTTCAQMRAQVGLFRQQASLIVDREHLQVNAGSSSQAILGVELHLRHACRGAQGAYQPYRETVAASPGGFVQAP